MLMILKHSNKLDLHFYLVLIMNIQLQIQFDICSENLTQKQVVIVGQSFKDS